MIGAKINQYKILEKIGSGGQGTVYKALDTKLERPVVIKVLPPELTVKSSNFKRFQREAQLCSSLDHPNICTIYDLNESEDGLHYIAMQYVEGKNVRQIVNGRPLDLRSSLSIAIQVADALAAAHAKGVIHRDVKAGNIMVNEHGQVKILDFGLAKLIHDEDDEDIRPADRNDLTEIGVPYGTATYAAPEQARGDKVDYRADIFSTGVLLYEMLAGIWPFKGKTVVDVRHAVLYDQPEPLSEVRSEPIPVRVQEILDKAMAKKPQDRYQKISEMRDDLKQVLHDISGDNLDMSLYSPRHIQGKNVVKRAWNFLRGKSESESPSFRTGQSSSSQPPAHVSSDLSLSNTMTSDKKSIAILPFKNLNNDPSSSFYEFSLADAVITELAQIRSLIVRPSSVIAKYQGKEIDPREAGQELRVNAVLSAGFLRSGEKMRVTAQLLDVAGGEILWSDRIDAEGADIFDLQDIIGQRILGGLRLELTDGEQEMLGRRATDNVDAYEEYLRARDNFGRFIFRTVSMEDCDAAIANFKRAVELDPQFALAYSGLGACYANRVFKGLGNYEDFTAAETAFSKAIKYDPNVLEARVLMVMIYLSRGEKKKARAEIKVLQEQFPNDAALYFVKGTMSRLDGDYQTAIKSWDRLVRLDPAARVVASYNKARILMYQEKFDEALTELDAGAKMEPDHPLIKFFRSRLFYEQGKVDDAIALISEVLEHNPKMHGIRPVLAIYLARQGRIEEARAQLTEKVEEAADADHDSSLWMAGAYALLGDKEKALHWLEHAVKLGNLNYPWYEKVSILESIRNEPRFIELIENLKKNA
ncbi:MAG TPA: protein kinase [Pyrinomonadaceae bacterium]|jgi:serine/threonine-protein kinase|nr:protein kinase [Pyrinomonadaceae bacterium]